MHSLRSGQFPLYIDDLSSGSPSNMRHIDDVTFGENEMRQIAIKRIYEPAAREDGFRVLVDRVWPGGVSKEEAAVDHWAKDIAPSTQLRKWFGHDPARWAEFKERYRAELDERKDQLHELLAIGGNQPLTLVFSAKDVDHNQAVVLKEVLEGM